MKSDIDIVEWARYLVAATQKEDEQRRSRLHWMEKLIGIKKGERRWFWDGKLKLQYAQATKQQLQSMPPTDQYLSYCKKCDIYHSKYKLCTCCSKWKEIHGNFWKDKRNIDGHEHQCSTCRSRKEKERRLDSWKKQYQAELADWNYSPHAHGDGLRQCNLCETARPYSEFGNDRSNKHGKKSRCKKCESMVNEARAGELAETIESIRCKQCNQVKSPDLFRKIKARKIGRDNVCKGCRSIKDTRKKIHLGGGVYRFV